MPIKFRKKMQDNENESEKKSVYIISFYLFSGWKNNNSEFDKQFKNTLRLFHKEKNLQVYQFIEIHQIVEVDKILWE